MFYIEENNRYDRKLVKNPIEGIGLLFEGENTSLAAWIEFGHLVSFLWLLPQHWLFKKTETYCFMILEDGSQRQGIGWATLLLKALEYVLALPTSGHSRSLVGDRVI